MNQALQSRESILTAAVAVAVSAGLQKMTRERVAKRAGIGAKSLSIVNFHYDTMAKLRAAVVQHAVDNEVLPIVADALSMGHPLAKKAPEALRKRAALSLVS